jgi:hypothetical protein
MFVRITAAFCLLTKSSKWFLTNAFIWSRVSIIAIVRAPQNVPRWPRLIEHPAFEFIIVVVQGSASPALNDELEKYMSAARRLKR